MEIPGGAFIWRAMTGDGTTPCLLIDVDLGDAHGTGSHETMYVRIEDGGVNEYVSARDFISQHEAASYTAHKEPVLNMNWLEEIARKVRAASEPVLKTIKTLEAAMLDQH